MSPSQIKEEKWDALKAIYYLKILANTGRINSELLGTPSIFFPESVQMHAQFWKVFL